jgi:hypothetical protein
MARLTDVVARFRHQPSPPECTSHSPFRLVSTLDDQATAAEVKHAWGDRVVPADLIDLWSVSRCLRLFEDVEYGQWGLVLLEPSACAARTRRELEQRPDQLRADDVVIGEFLGDQELLVLAPSESGQRRVLVALPLDDRSEWWAAGPNLADFLDEYFDHEGEKFWEER